MPADFKNNAEMEEIHFPVHTATLGNHPGNVQKSQHVPSGFLCYWLYHQEKFQGERDQWLIDHCEWPELLETKILYFFLFDQGQYWRQRLQEDNHQQPQSHRSPCWWPSRGDEASLLPIYDSSMQIFLEIMDFGLAAAVKSRNSPDIFRASLFLSKIPVNEALKSMGSTVSTSTICRRYTRFQYAPTIKRNIQRDGKAGALMTAYLSSCSANAQR